ncbi:uncharacterized protein TNCV_4599111 [Trichonephila clavipes]|nr:uncharacterized protein TNCV_4599111 [Trichonephila clavipes]
MDDNTRPHRAAIVEEYLEGLGLERMKLPARSPDLNPIENLWDCLGRQLFTIWEGEGEREKNNNWVRLAFSVPKIVVAAVAEWYRYRTVACFVTGSNPVPLKTRRVGQRCTLNLSRAETSSRWCGVVVRRGGASSGVVHVT